MNDKIDRATLYRSVAEEVRERNVPEPSTPAPHGSLPRARRPLDDLRQELAQREAEEARAAEEQRKLAEEQARKARELDEIVAEAKPVLDAIVETMRKALPGVGALARRLEVAEQAARRDAYAVDGQAGDGSVSQRLGAHPVQRLRPLLDMLRDDQPGR